MSSAFQQLKTLSPQPSLVTPGTAQRISTSELQVRSAIITATASNAGPIQIADTAVKAQSGPSETLLPGESLELSGDNFQGRFIEIDLNEIFFDGVVAGETLDVSYKNQDPGTTTVV